MPCALTSGADYPDYLKSILKEIDAGNDEALKVCACALKSPVTDGGCTILDEDDKIVAFPFCLPTETIANNNFYYDSEMTVSIGLSYKQAMNIYWKRKAFNMKFEGYGVGPGCRCDEDKKPGTSIGNTSFKCEEVSLKDLVCTTPKGGTVDGKTPAQLEPNARKGLTTRSDSCYADPPPPYFGVTFEIFGPSFKLVGEQYIIERAWIDREAKKIYPVIQVYINMNGCCGILGPTDASVSDSTITINAATIAGSTCQDNPGNTLVPAGGKGKVEITDFMA